MSSRTRIPLILLVEDSEDDAFFFRWTLDKCGLEANVVHVTDGAAAIAYFRGVLDGTRPSPDMTFLDLKLPTFRGFEVLAWLSEPRFETPLDIAVLSGSDHDADLARARALGISAYYVKPLSVEQLRARFAAWHERQHAEARALPEGAPA